MEQHGEGPCRGGIIKAPGLALGNIDQPDLHRHRYPHQAAPGKRLRHHFTDHLDGTTPTSVQPASLQNLYTNHPHLNANFIRNRIALIKLEQSVRTGPAIHDSEACTVRVFLYCPETGVYQGEDFVEECRFDRTEGATHIAPPICVYGEVPMFDTSTKCWRIIKLPKKRLSPPMDQS